jgi:hypothetical protein
MWEAVGVPISPAKLAGPSFCFGRHFPQGCSMIVQRSWSLNEGLKSLFTSYDAVAMAFVLVEIICIFLAVIILI